jgi:hypothetical protein
MPTRFRTQVSETRAAGPEGDQFCNGCCQVVSAPHLSAFKDNECHMKNIRDLEQQFYDFAASIPMAPLGNGIDGSAVLRDGTIKQSKALDSLQVDPQFPKKLRQQLKMATGAPRSEVSFS